MFQVDRPANRLRRLARTTFSDAGFTERGHLQEWLAAGPDALGQTLGDDLLIIQKEFDGFDGTRERLDLLALDRQGQLVVIENKLDDSGRDVVWQALKYAAYCSSLKKAEIVDIFQRYLDRSGGGDATETIREFLGEDAWEEVILNAGNDQRIVFIAANFRREVTATVLWLREHGIDARCIRVVPYRFGEEVLVDLQQVIPTPEAADYMIRIAQKETEQKSALGARDNRHDRRMAFWDELLSEMRSQNIQAVSGLSPSKYYWLNTSVGITGCSITFHFLKDQIGIQLEIKRPTQAENKRIFDNLEKGQSELDTAFGEPLIWERKDAKVRSHIRLHLPIDTKEADNWPEMIAWMIDKWRRVESTFSEPLREAVARVEGGRS
ncbi:DUF4268 domain-containing protein [uncultured Jannaschia sp.]|uniref:DUF4268 domain-containing protein n=1 Tax=uncultured Jannaschia sp. TaxID=293347 RepID=UPI002636D5A8|nr:DUF4268 domain-containing protein [uncultured Jannaschia sp.]